MQIIMEIISHFFSTMFSTMEVGQKIKQFRTDRNESLTTFAYKAGVSRDRLAKWEQLVSKPNYEDLQKLATYMEIDVDTLIGKEFPQNTTATDQIPTYSKKDITLSPDGKLKRNKVLADYNQVPYYDVDFIAGNTMETVDSGATQPAYFMNVPIFKDCAAFNCYSDSMEPVIMKGSIIFCTYVEDWQDVLEYGQTYAISLKDNRRFLKYIVRHESKSDTHFMLRSENTHYDSFEVPKAKIKGIWLVHGWMNKRTQ